VHISFRPIGGDGYAGTYRLKNNRRSPTSGTFVRHAPIGLTVQNYVFPEYIDFSSCEARTFDLSQMQGVLMIISP